MRSKNNMIGLAALLKENLSRWFPYTPFSTSYPEQDGNKGNMIFMNKT